ncbi:MAG: protein-S-isoprenylcysteine O-methyltransferase Ste14 [Candidatus Aldehydirespiratoraceae bacterium]|jgi:protein-S-isoprenylcysteine O-methyltransferase Ste14
MATTALVLYVVMFFVVFVLRTVIQKRKTGDSGIRAGVLGANVGSIEWIAGWALLTALVAGFVSPIVDLLGLDPLTENNVVRGAGVVLAIAGTGLTFVAQMMMGESWRVGVDHDEVTGLVTGGIFGIVRNPIFSALMLAGFGFALMVPNPLSITAFVLLVASVELQVRFVEEPYLRQVQGAAYGKYTAAVGRFVPGLGR